MIKAELKGRDALTRRLNQLAPKVEIRAAHAKLDIAREAAEAIAARAPVGEDGSYAASIHAERLDGASGVPVGINATKDKDAAGVFANFLWRFLEFGTRAHDIEAKGDGKLVFRGANGALVTTSKVKHPGSAAQPHIFPTWRAMKKKARKKMLAAVNKAVREAMGK